MPVLYSLSPIFMFLIIHGSAAFGAGLHGAAGDAIAGDAARQALRGAGRVAAPPGRSVALPQILSVEPSSITFGAGEAFDVYFTTSGVFTAGNVFTAQMSNLVGDFSNPRVLGVLESTSQGVISGKLPCDLSDGVGYRIRVVASKPALAGPDNGVGLTIRPRVPMAVTASGPTTICQGDSVRLTGNPGYVWYHWNTNDTTRSIVVRQTGVYTLTVLDSNDCGLVARATVTVRIPPKPPVRIRNGVVLETDFGFVSFQWNLNGTPIPDATGPTLKLIGPGSYTVTVSDTDGCYGTSDAKVTPGQGVIEGPEADADVKIFPHPAHESITVEAELDHAADVTVRVSDALGREILRRDPERAAGHYHREIWIEDFPAGTYLVQVQLGTRTVIEKVVKQ